jgi:hypothetical protein
VTWTGGDNPQKDFYYVQTPKSDRDLGINRINREAAMAWMVFGPSHQTRRGELYGDYGGVHGSATVRGGQALVGGSENSFALRPLDAVAARVAELKLVEGR